MSMYEQAKNINSDLEQLFNAVYIRDFSIEQRERLIDIFLRFGAVAKFRCRSNIAYDNFSKECFKGIADLERVPISEGSDFTVLKATMKPLTVYEDYLMKNNKEDTKDSFIAWTKTFTNIIRVI